MAITVTSAVATISTSNTTSYTSASFTPAANDQLVAFVVASDTLDAGALSDTQSLGWTQLESETWFDGGNKFYCFIATTLAAATSMTVTFTCLGDAATGCIIHVVRVAGASTPAGTYVQSKANFDNPAPSSTPEIIMDDAIDTDNCVIALATNLTFPAAGVTPAPSSFTELIDTAYGNPPTGLASSYRISGQGGTTLTWSGSPLTEAWATMAIEFSPEGGPDPDPDPEPSPVVVTTSVLLKSFMGSSR